MSPKIIDRHLVRRIPGRPWRRQGRVNFSEDGSFSGGGWRRRIFQYSGFSIPSFHAFFFLLRLGLR